MNIIDKVWKGIKMKLTENDEERLQRKRSDTERRWMEIYLYWIEVREQKGVVKQCVEKFSCSKNVVMTAISYGIKFGKDGVFNKNNSKP